MESLNLFTENNNIVNQNNICSICLHDMNDKNLTYEIKECKHVFHTNCLIEWFRANNSCPLCRSTTERRYSPFSMFKFIINFLKSKKNNYKSFQNIYKKYKKLNDNYKLVNNSFKLFEKDNKNVLKEYKKIRRLKREAFWKLQRIKREISSLPITPLFVIQKKNQ
jgi:hypothetical protein